MKYSELLYFFRKCKIKQIPKMDFLYSRYSRYFVVFLSFLEYREYKMSMFGICFILYFNSFLVKAVIQSCQEQRSRMKIERKSTGNSSAPSVTCSYVCLCRPTVDTWCVLLASKYFSSRLLLLYCLWLCLDIAIHWLRCFIMPLFCGYSHFPLCRHS